MFAVVDLGGVQMPYEPGVFRNRKVPKIAKKPASKPLGREPQSFKRALNQSPTTSPIGLYEQVRAYSHENLSASLVARDIMVSPVATLPVTASLAQAWEFVKNTQFRHIPIQSEKGTLVGILSDRDLSRGTVDAAIAGIKGSAYLDQITIEPYISHPVLVTDPDASILALARVLVEEHIGAIPVVSHEKNLLGMITRSDILWAIVSHPNFEDWG